MQIRSLTVFVYKMWGIKSCVITVTLHHVFQLVVDLTQSVHQLKPVWIASVKIRALTHNVEWMQYAELTQTIVLAAIVQTITVETLLHSVADLNALEMMNVHTT